LLTATASGAVLTTAISALSFSPDGEVGIVDAYFTLLVFFLYVLVGASSTGDPW
jgi:hypothetical protein